MSPFELDPISYQDLVVSKRLESQRTTRGSEGSDGQSLVVSAALHVDCVPGAGCLSSAIQGKKWLSLCSRVRIAAALGDIISTAGSRCSDRERYKREG